MVILRKRQKKSSRFSWKIDFSNLIHDICIYNFCCNLSLRLVTKTRACKVVSQEGSLGVTPHVLGSEENVREWTFTLPRELPPWELESWWVSKFSESDCRVQNSMDWKIPYIIKNILKCRCLKWAHMTHLDIWNTSLGSGVKLAIWFPTIKSQESPQFSRVQVACDIPLKSSRWGLQLCFRSHFNQRFTCKVMGLQSRMSPSCENFMTPTWESWDKMSFGCRPHGEAQNIL